VIDIVIETQLAGLNILILVECKYYKRRVEIADVLEFAERLDDVGAQKGAIVTTVGFQDGATKVARGRGIALIVTEPVWQVIMPSKQGGEIVAFTTAGVVIGGEPAHALFLGTTPVCANFAANVHAKATQGWRSIVECLTAECDETARKAYIDALLRDQYTPVCPFCGAELQTPRARQCRHCKTDWHSLPPKPLGPPIGSA
jgi:ribosomal protein L40E